MNKEYLFEKAGSDAELERLEGLLAVYRFQPGGPPVLIEKTPAARSWSFGWLRFSFAAGAVAVAVFAGLLAYGRIEKQLLNADGPAISENMPVSASTPVSVDPIAPSPDVKPVKVSDRKAPSVRQHFAVRAVYKKPEAATRLFARAKPAVTLTKREKYAYDQLMVALYITGSKLKVVQDTIDRTDERKTLDAANEK